MDSVLIASSANALRALHNEDVARLSPLRLICVGEKTAATARKRGFEHVEAAGGSGERLAAKLIDELPPTTKLLYLTGTPRKPVIEHRLSAAGFAVITLDLYRTVPVTPWPGRPFEAVMSCDAAMHFSRGSVEALLAAVKAAGHESALVNLRHYCLSADVAEPLRANGAPEIAICDHPSEKCLFDMLQIKEA
jgi:uroporphyrinogen-III synthase